MRHWHGLVVGLTLWLAVAGCGGSNVPADGETDSPAAKTTASAKKKGETTTSKDAADGPKAALEKFLSAIKAGDDETAASMLTPLAREKTTAMGLNVAPPGSDTASFRVSQIEFKGTSGAYVACEWNEIDENGELSTDQVVWVMAKQEDGWRIAGMVAKVFPDLDAIVFNFEDPEDMVRKQEMAMQEMERRAAAVGESNLVAEGAEADSATQASTPATEASAARPPRTRAQ